MKSFISSLQLIQVYLFWFWFGSKDILHKSLIGIFSLKIFSKLFLVSEFIVFKTKNTFLSLAKAQLSQ